MENESRSEYIIKPNLKMAQLIFIVAILSELFFSNFFLSILGIDTSSYTLYLFFINTVFYIGAMILWGQYIYNFELRRTSLVMYIIAWCNTILLIMSIVILISSKDIDSSSYTESFGYIIQLTSATYRIVQYAIIVLIAIAGYDMLKCKTDFVGGVRQIGQLMLFIVAMHILNIACDAFIYLAEYASLNDDNNMLDIISNISNVGFKMLYISLLAYMLYVIRGAMHHNKRVKEEDIEE